MRVNPKPISRARHAAYIDALLDHTMRRDHGARSAFIKRVELPESDWNDYRDIYEQKFGELCESHRALQQLRYGGQL